MGTPDETTWPGVSSLPDFKPTFPKWQARSLATLVSELDASGVDLLGRMLALDPNRRISAKEALRHPWFNDLDKSAFADDGHTA